MRLATRSDESFPVSPGSVIRWVKARAQQRCPQIAARRSAEHGTIRKKKRSTKKRFHLNASAVSVILESEEITQLVHLRLD
jgi:diketogulonate reductase-like aldo/keto reductase